MKEGKIIKKDGETTKKPAVICNVRPLDGDYTGVDMQLVVGTVLASILSEEYPDGEYVGKAFEITRHAKEDGKAYKKYSAYELDV